MHSRCRMLVPVLALACRQRRKGRPQWLIRQQWLMELGLSKLPPPPCGERRCSADCTGATAVEGGDHRRRLGVVRFPSNLAQGWLKSRRLPRSLEVAMTAHKLLRFEGFTLDLDRLCLDGPTGQANLRR